MSGLPVLLAHGMGSSFTHNWRLSGWLDLLASEDREVLPFSLPGHGGEPSLGAPPDSAGTRVLTALAGRGPVDAVGFSAGAAALLEAACSDPTAFRRVALLGIGDAMLHRRTAGIPALAAAVSDDADSDSTTSVRTLIRTIRSAGNDRGAVAGYLGAMPPAPSFEVLSRMDLPILICLGERDPVGSAERLVAALPRARLVILRGIDHFNTPASFQCQDEVMRFLTAPEADAAC